MLFLAFHSLFILILGCDVQNLFCYIFLFSFAPLLLISQVSSGMEELIEEEIFYNENSLLELYLENLLGDDFTGEVLEEIEYLRANPIILSKSDAQTIATIPSISIQKAVKIKRFISNAKKSKIQLDFNTLREVASLSDMELFFLQLCTQIDDRLADELAKAKGFYRARSLNRMQAIRGLEEDRYVGDGQGFYQRILARTKSYQASVTTSKNVGEPSLFERYGAFLQYAADSTKLIVGDFSLDIGMGNILWRGFGTRKGLDAIAPIANFGSGIRPVSSFIPSGRFRGVAFQKEGKIIDELALSVGAFLSQNSLSANVQENQFVSSVSSYPYFRTQNERRNKNSLQENAFGSFAGLTYNRLSVGGVIYNLSYDKELQTVSKAQILGENATLASVFGMYKSEDLVLSFETSKDGENNSANRVGALVNWEGMEFGMQYRNIDNNFRSPHGFNFGESATVSNEQGLYTGFAYKFENMRLSMYVDYYATNGATFYISQQSRGVDLFSNFEYKFDGGVLNLRFKFEDKSDFLSNSTTNSRDIFFKNRTALRIDYSKKITWDISLRLVAENTHISFQDFKPREQGLLMFGEVWYDVFEFLKLQCRATYFSSDSFDSGIWIYEYIAPGNAQVINMFGQGERMFITAILKPIDGLNIRARYARLSKSNVQRMGSSWEQTYIPRDDRLTVQLDFSF